MKNEHYRIKLFKGSDTICDNIVCLAAKSNGGEKISLYQLKTIIDGQRLLYPSLYSDTTAEIIGDTLLHIDKKISDIYETVCSIELIEHWELTENELDKEVESIL